MKKKKLMIKLATLILAIFCTVNLNAAGKNGVETVPAETQQTTAISGTVVDKSGEALPGVSVSVKGTNIGTATDINGRYSLSVPAKDAVLVFSYVGFSPQQIAVNNRTTIDVTLSEDTQSLEEVVVVGYGTAKKADLAGSVATLNARDLQTVPVANLSNALAGRLTGVDVRQGSGGKPGNAAEVTIGARGTWNNTSPLYVIDGIVRDGEAFNMLNSSDIESFSVLKDASAAAVYGARAANGVFLITTKRGKSGKPTINYAGSYSAGEPAYEPRRETFEERYRITQVGQLEMRNVLGIGKQITNDGYVPYATSIYKNGTDASGGYINTSVFSDEAYAYYQANQYDRMAEVYHTPVTETHSLNISGGNDYVNYFVSGNLYDESGMFSAVNYKKSTIRSNIETKITSNLTASLSVNLSNDNNQSAYGQNDRMTAVYNNLIRSSWLAPTMVDGQYIVNELDNTTGGNDSAAAIANGDAGLEKKQKWLMEYTAGLEWDVPWVKGLKGKLLYNRYSRHEYLRKEPKQYEAYALLRGNNPATEYAQSGGKDPNGQILVPELGAHMTRGNHVVEQSDVWNNTYQFNTQISYNNTFGKHALEGVLVYEQTETASEWLGGNKPNLTVPSRPYLSFGDSDKTNWNMWGAASESGRISYVGRFGYTFDSRYQASFSFRQDYSSKFGPTNTQRKGFFPAGNVYWRVSEESFLKEVEWLNNLKIRASLGLTGNDNVTAFQYLNTADVNKNGTYWGGTNAASPGVEFGVIANPSITWEKTLNRNLGLDLAVFNMFNVSTNLWKKHTYDILGKPSGDIPDTFGGTFGDVNYGIVDSYGFDIEVGFNKQINKNLNIWARGNFGWADNKLVEYAEASGVPEHLSKIGLNYDRWATFKSDGVIHTMKPQLDAQGVQVTKDYGDGRGAQPMYVVTTSTGHTYIIPKNYWVSGSGYYIDNNSYNNLRPGVVFPVDLGGVDADGNMTGPDGHWNNASYYDKYWGITHFNPPYTYGLALGGSWKGLSLEVLVQGEAGFQNYMSTENMANAYWYGTSWGFWSGEAFSLHYNPNGEMPILVNGPGFGNENIDFWVHDASYLRLKNVTLSYDFPKQILSKLKISGLKVYVAGQNLCFLYNAFKFFDPELTTYINTNNNQQNLYNSPGSTDVTSNTRFYDSGVMNYPLMRTVTFGAALSF